MGKFLGIDYGLKRIGLAETDDLGIIASPLETISTKKLFVFIQNYLGKNELEGIVLGLPKRLDGSDTHITNEVYKVQTKLINTFSIAVHLYDERFTSKMATASIIESGIGKKRRQEKGLVDKISAAIILRDFIASKK